MLLCELCVLCGESPALPETQMLNTLWLIPIVPFAGFLLNGFFGKRAGKSFVTAVALAGSLGAALLGTWAVIEYNSRYHERIND